ncbi:GntR family transcriptional regulator [Burkholderiaceae bacterium 16]|nr:GntR family transcriptional regulator [Burkholderiaceae bacterium 16]
MPLFKDIEAELRQRIVSNSWVPGFKLPSEAELMAEFSVSRITVRQALAGLHNSGLIEKVNGKGSFVTRPSDKPDLGPLHGFYETHRARGKTAHGKLVSVRSIKAPVFVARALKLPPDEKVLAVTTVRYLDDLAVGYFVIMGREPLMRRIAEADPETNDVMSLLESRLGYRLSEVVSDVTAVGAPKAVARRLGVEEGAPLLRLQSTPYDFDGGPILCGELYFRGESQPVRVRSVRRTPSSAR